jgi:hypothetical protein
MATWHPSSIRVTFTWIDVVANGSAMSLASRIK